MIIFNLFAIPVIVLIVLSGFGLDALRPGMLGGPYGILLMCGVTIVIAGISELVGLAGRLFFLPIWLLGIIVGLYELYGLMGTTGRVVLVGAALGLVALAVMKLRPTNDSFYNIQLDEAQSALRRAKAKLAAGSTTEMWSNLNKALIFDAKGTYTNGQCIINRAVVSLIRDKVDDLPDDTREKLRELVELLQAGEVASGPVTIASEKFTPLKELLKARAP